MDPRGKITDFEAASSYQLLASSFAVLAHAWCTSLQHLGAARIWKDQNDLSQLNRLVFLAIGQDSNFVGAQPLIVISALPRFWQCGNYSLSSVQVLTKDQRRTTND